MSDTTPAPAPTPATDATATATETAKKTKGKRAAKTKVDKYNGFAVPPRTRATSCGCIHIYEMMKEANPTLLEREDVKAAFNDLVACFDSLPGEIQTWNTPKYNRYNPLTIMYKKSTYEYALFGSLPITFSFPYDQWKSPEYKKRSQEVQALIMPKYEALYNLIKRDVIPYMETKQHEIRSKSQIESYHAGIDKYERLIKQAEESIIAYRKIICEYAQKSIDLSKPAKLTKFDDE
jgi:hypothetical protein